MQGTDEIFQIPSSQSSKVQPTGRVGDVSISRTQKPSNITAKAPVPSYLFCTHHADRFALEEMVNELGNEGAAGEIQNYKIT